MGQIAQLPVGTTITLTKITLGSAVRNSWRGLLTEPDGMRVETVSGSLAGMVTDLTEEYHRRRKLLEESPP